MHPPMTNQTMNTQNTTATTTLAGATPARSGSAHCPATKHLVYWFLLVANYSSLFIGSLSASLLSRFYFVHGGSSRWVATWVQCAGFPLLLIPICFPSSSSYFPLRRPFSGIGRRRLALSLIVGLLLGINNFLISWGVSYLPVSTSSLLLSSQLAFTLLLSVLIAGVRLRFTSLNSVVLITLASVLLALGARHDRPAGVTTPQFLLGLLSTLGAAILFALYLPVAETIYRGVSSYRAVVEMQMVMEVVATVFATVGMAADGGEWRKEAAVFDLGRGAYWGTVVATVVAWQMVFMGVAGMVFLTSSLGSGICTTALLALNVVGGVVVFGDKFEGDKAVATALCLWGFASYLYGEFKVRKEEGGEKVEEGRGGEEMKRIGDGVGGEREIINV